MSSKNSGYLLAGVGIALLLWGGIWAAVVGYYPDQLPVILVLIFGGLGLAVIGQRIVKKAREAEVHAQIAKRDGQRH